MAAAAVASLPASSGAQVLRPAELRTRLSAVRGALDHITGRLDAASRRLDEAAVAAEFHAGALRRASSERRKITDALGKRSAQLYIMGSRSDLGVLLTSNNVTNFIDRVSYLQQVRRGERGLLEDLEILKRRGAEETELLRVALVKARASRNAFARRQRELSRKLYEYRTLLRFLDLAGGTSSGRSRRGARGFVCPVAGGAAVSNDFGAPRRGGPHAGNDIHAPHGARVVAVLPSRVVKTPTGGWVGIGITIRDALGNEWLYAHLSSRNVGVGDTLVAGQGIGRVGCTGHCSGPHLHFEYHPGGGGPRDPYRILSKAC